MCTWHTSTAGLPLQLSLLSTLPEDPMDWIPFTELSILADSILCGASLDHPAKHPLKPKGQSFLVTLSHRNPSGPLVRVDPHSNDGKPPGQLQLRSWGPLGFSFLLLLLLTTGFSSLTGAATTPSSSCLLIPIQSSKARYEGGTLLFPVLLLGTLRHADDSLPVPGSPTGRLVPA